MPRLRSVNAANAPRRRRDPAGVMLWIDLETRSQEDLIKHGLERYARHPTTQVICMAYAFDDEPIQFWWAQEEFPQQVIDHFLSGGAVTAHNAEFERALFEWVICPDYDFEPAHLEQWRCSMVMALTSGFPGGLDGAASAIGVPFQKHKEGRRLIMTYCAPNFLRNFENDDAELMKTYCSLDVEVSRAVAKSCRPLTAAEWAEYHLTCKINERGLPVDVELCAAALHYADEVQADAAQNIATLTGRAVTKPTERKNRDKWLYPRLTEDQIALLVVYKKGVKKYSLDQDHRGYLLACDDLDHDARQLLEFINDAGSSALKKFTVATNQHVGGRVHQTFQFNGAQTGRFSGRGLQPHNMRRDVWDAETAETLITDIKDGYQVDQPATTMARLLRAMITHKDGLYWVDWSAIEGRVAPWLANSDEGEEKLDIYREGRDVYVVTAAGMFDLDEAEVDKTLRQSGKIAELSLQFGGGKGALIGMAKNYGVIFTDDEGQDIVHKWRRANPWAETIWNQYQNAIDDAVLNPGVPYEVGRVAYQSDGERFLWCQLPSGRLLPYPFPKWEEYMTPWEEERIGPTFQTHFKPAYGAPPLRNFARGALLFQNTVQAVAADILREALLAADDEGLEIVASVHDEIIGLGSYEEGCRLNEIMLQRPWWSDGLPLNTGGVQYGTRWGK